MRGGVMAMHRTLQCYLLTQDASTERAKTAHVVDLHILRA